MAVRGPGRAGGRRGTARPAGFGRANYAAAKSGMFGLTMSVALETASKGSAVTSVTPDYITPT